MGSNVTERGKFWGEGRLQECEAGMFPATRRHKQSDVERLVKGIHLSSAVQELLISNRVQITASVRMAPGRSRSKPEANERSQPAQIDGTDDIRAGPTVSDQSLCTTVVQSMCPTIDLSNQQPMDMDLTSPLAPAASLPSGSCPQQAQPTQSYDLQQQQQHVLAYLGQRFVSCRSPAAMAMRVRSTLAKLEGQLTNALSCMIKDATSVSVLVLGDPGSGKTLLVERSIATAYTTHNLDGNCMIGVVRLSGLLHLDERVAFQEIAKQLCSEFGQEFSKTATFDENLSFLRNMLATLHHHFKSVVFVLDNFERFARARGKQQLLYNLFDVLQHSQVQAAVIGVTCAQDVMESMEKRVRSRFSHRRMLLTALTHLEVPSPSATAAQAPPEAPKARRPLGSSDADDTAVVYGDTPAGILQDILTLPTPGAGTTNAMGPSNGSRASTIQGTSTGAQASASSAGLSDEYCRIFNEAVSLAARDKQVQDALKPLFIAGLKPRTLVAAAHAALSAWQADSNIAAHTVERKHPMPTVEHLIAGVLSQVPASMAREVCDLSTLQLYLVVGMARLENKAQTTYNFEMIWDECQSLRGDNSGVISCFTHGAAWRAFEELVASNIAYWISPNAEASGRAMRYAGVSLAVPISAVSEALRDAERVPSQLLEALP